VAGGLTLPRGLAEPLVEHAWAELPNEACALLGGDTETGRVSSVHPARNRLASPYRYDVDPDDLVRIVHEIESRGEAMVAIFHSHPATPAVLSPTDLREARYPVFHLVASLAGPSVQIRAWRIHGGAAAEVPLTLE
jgi:[CysO sulfur-carrier protein]-S-L-cysteine hydrolase